MCGSVRPSVSTSLWVPVSVCVGRPRGALAHAHKEGRGGACRRRRARAEGGAAGAGRARGRARGRAAAAAVPALGPRPAGSARRAAPRHRPPAVRERRHRRPPPPLLLLLRLLLRLLRPPPCPSSRRSERARWRLLGLWRSTSRSWCSIRPPTSNSKVRRGERGAAEGRGAAAAGCPVPPGCRAGSGRRVPRCLPRAGRGAGRCPPAGGWGAPPSRRAGSAAAILGSRGDPRCRVGSAAPSLPLPPPAPPSHRCARRPGPGAAAPGDAGVALRSLAVRAPSGSSGQERPWSGRWKPCGVPSFTRLP